MRTPGQELCDTLISIQMRVKVLEELIESHKNGLRTQFDFESRFRSNAFAITREMSKLKCLTDSLFLQGQSAFEVENMYNNGYIKEIIASTKTSIPLDNGNKGPVSIDS